MSWINDLEKAIEYMEEHLLEKIDAEQVSQQIYVSRDYFHRVFNVITGFTVNEYIRNRRLSLAAQEIAATGHKIIDIAYKYHYETPESFTKAFTRLYGYSPSEMRRKKLKPRIFYPLTIQIVLKGGFHMSKILDVRSVGWVEYLNDDRAPESMAFPACMTSLMEQLGNDVRWKTFSGHGRKWKKRRLYDDFLAATGMSFGLLWHVENCVSCTDLTNVNEHNQTITQAYDYAGYDCAIVGRTETNREEMKQLIMESIDSGCPVLAFGLVGPPECAIVCGYDYEGETLLGWSHFQSHAPEDCFDNGMFRVSDWHQQVWKIVLCREPKEPQNHLNDIIRRGCEILKADNRSGYEAGAAAYDRWIEYINNPAYETMNDKELKQHYWLHHVMIGNHAEARWSLRDFIHERADGNEELKAAATCFIGIHNTCWKIWNAAGGIDAKDAFLCLKDTKKKKEITKLIKKLKTLDMTALKHLQNWLDS